MDSMNLEVLKALANEIRMQIVCMLVEKDMSAGEIAAHFGIAQPSVSRHLQILKQAGVVSVTRDCTRIIYSVEQEKLKNSIIELTETLVK